MAMQESGLLDEFVVYLLLSKMLIIDQISICVGLSVRKQDLDLRLAPIYGFLRLNIMPNLNFV